MNLTEIEQKLNNLVIRDNKLVNKESKQAKLFNKLVNKYESKYNCYKDSYTNKRDDDKLIKNLTNAIHEYNKIVDTQRIELIRLNQQKQKLLKHCKQFQKSINQQDECTFTDQEKLILYKRRLKAHIIKICVPILLNERNKTLKSSTDLHTVNGIILNENEIDLIPFHVENKTEDFLQNELWNLAAETSKYSKEWDCLFDGA